MTVRIENIKEDKEYFKLKELHEFGEIQIGTLLEELTDLEDPYIVFMVCDWNSTHIFFLCFGDNESVDTINVNIEESESKWKLCDKSVKLSISN